MAGAFRVQATGLDGFIAGLSKLSTDLPRALGDELYHDAVVVMADSQKIVPYDEGDLHDSGEVDRPQVNGARVEVRLHYGDAQVDYALVQHEDLTLNHPNGGSAKFLETPFEAWKASGEPAQAITRALRRVAGR